MRRRQWLILPLLMVLLLLQFCAEKQTPQGPQFTFAKGNSCVDCHTSETALKKVATPLPPPSGEAGEG